MAQHDVEIEISKTGRVRVHVKGAKGKRCLDYVKWFGEVVGSVESRTLTAEFYEPEVKSGIDVEGLVEDKE